MEPHLLRPMHFFACINYEDSYVQPLIVRALQAHFHDSSYTLVSSGDDVPTPTAPLLQITSYETIDFTHLLAHPITSFANAYVIRKALIRKHHLAYTVSAWCAKFPESPLQRHVKPTLHLELDYAEFLDDALLEAYELHDSFARNGARTAENSENGEAEDALEWWILKPSMSDRGQGIRIFSSEDELRAIFEEWEVESDSEDDEDPVSDPSPAAGIHEQDGEDDGPASNIEDNENPAVFNHTAGGITSLLRHFVVQPYIHPPLLFPAFGNRKFHIRSYVLALGALRVYLYEEMLALFAPLPYAPPSASPSGFDPGVHLTNTCLRNSPSEAYNNNTTGTNTTSGDSSPHPSTTPLTLFSSLPSSLPNDQTKNWKAITMDTIALATSELFLAAARTQSTHFQPLPNCFEIFGLDWMVDSSGHVWLLEVNAFPDFAQSGDGVGKGVVQGLWEGVLGLVGMAWFNGEQAQAQDEGKGTEERWGMRKLLDVDLGRR